MIAHAMPLSVLCRLAAPPAALALAACTLASCSSSHVECDCVEKALRVHVPASRAASVVDVMASGTACDGVGATCVESVAGAGTSNGSCITYRIAARASGFCNIDVDFAAGAPRFSASARVVPGNSCCGGFIANPESAGEIDVPEDASDAGGAE